MSTSDLFPDYAPTTNETGVALVIFLMVYSALSVLLIAPLVIWGRQHEKQRQAATIRAGLYHPHPEFVQDPLAQNYQQQSLPQAALTAQAHGYPQNIEIQHEESFPERGHARVGSYGQRIPRNFFKELDRFSQRYPDDDPDFMSVVCGSQQRSRVHETSTTASHNPSNTENSNALSAATTSRLFQAQGTSPKTQVWDIGTRRWKHRRPIGRPADIRRVIQVETSSMGSSNLEARALTVQRHSPGSQASSRPSRVASRSLSKQQSTIKGMSEVASSILTTEELDRPGHRVIIEMANFKRVGPGLSISSNSELPTVVDDISPNDAADAGDPGRINSFEQMDEIEITVCCGPASLWSPRVLLMSLDGLIDVAEPDMEIQRIVGLGFPLTLGAMSEPFFRTIIVVLISQFIGTESMIAYVIVNLLIGFTNELVGAVADTENTLCSYALSTGQLFLAGQYVQISVVVHTILAVPILVIWTLMMEDIVNWLVGLEGVAFIAKSYTKIIVFHYFQQSLSRLFTVLFQLTGNELFEIRFGLGESIVNVALISCVVTLNKDATLSTVAWMQVLIGVAACISKLGYAMYKRWFRLFRTGFFTFALTNVPAVQALMMASFPLFLGAFLEYGEWEILMFIVARLGPAEVATWSILGVIWKLLESSTEGIGEAAAIRVAYHLGHNNPTMAKRSSYKALFVASIQSFFVTSLLFMGGKNIASLLTSDSTLQTLLNDTIALLGLGNVLMTYSMVTWNLVVAQGRYRLATLVILLSRWLITIPCAVLFAHGFNLDLESIMGSMIIGFATAGLCMAYVLFRSDWNRLAKILQELNAMMISDSDSDENSDEEESALGVNDDIEGTSTPV